MQRLMQIGNKVNQKEQGFAALDRPGLLPEQQAMETFESGKKIASGRDTPTIY
jgi:hypothetical protein